MNGDIPGSSDHPDLPGSTGVAASELLPDGGRSSLDVVLDALADRRRRYALYHLRDCRTATLREVAEQVAAWERDRPVETVTVRSDHRVYADFYHRHLPKLADADMVEYDCREELVRYDCSDLVEGVLDVARWVESPEND